MSFLKRLFGIGSGGSGEVVEPAAPKAAGRESYKDFILTATPIREGGQFRLAGTISKEVGGTTREHRFIRADLLASLEEAAQATLRKGRQIVDEQGDRVFDA